MVRRLCPRRQDSIYEPGGRSDALFPELTELACKSRVRMLQCVAVLGETQVPNALYCSVVVQRDAGRL